MKTTRKLWVAAVAILTAVFLVGCGNLTGVQVEKGEDMATLTATIMGDANVALSDSGAAASRNILPDAYTDGQTAGFDYYLTGTSVTGKKFNAGKHKLLSGDNAVTSGTFKYELDATVWDLTVFCVETGSAETTVAAYSQAEILANALLIGYANVDLSSGAGTAAFKLSPDGLTQKGNVKLTIMLKDNSSADAWATNLSTEYGSGAKAVMEIRNLIKGDIKATATPAFTSGSATFNPGAVDPGTYNFAVTFYNGTGAEIGEWSDVLVVMPGRNTEKTVYIPNIVGTKPVPPANLTAVYYKDSEDDTRLGFYKVHFQWENTPVNEKYYELQIIPLSDTEATGAMPGTVADNARIMYTENPKIAVSANDKFFISAEERCDGSLLANNTDCTLYLELGKKYQARIRAKNAVGESAWTNLVLTTGTTTDTGTYATDKITISGVSDSNIQYFASAATADKCINRYRVTYKLNGGRYKTSSTATKSSDKVEYDSVRDPATANVHVLWTGTGYDTHTAPIDTSTDTDCLRQGNSPIQSWTLTPKTTTAVVAELEKWALKTGKVPTTGITSGVTFTAAGYTGSANVTLYAEYAALTYELTGNITVTDPAKYKLLPEYVTYSIGPTGSIKTAACGSDGITSGKITISKSWGDTLSFIVNVPSEDGAHEPTGNIKFDTIELTVLNSRLALMTVPEVVNGAALGSDTAFTGFSINDFDNGSYTVKFRGTVKTSGNTIIREVNITMEIQD